MNYVRQLHLISLCYLCISVWCGITLIEIWPGILRREGWKYFTRKIEHHSWFLFSSHCLKSVQIRSFFWFVFSYIWTEYKKIPSRKNSVFGHFLRSVTEWHKLELTLRIFMKYSDSVSVHHCVKSVQIRSFFWSKYRKIRIKKYPYWDTFHAVHILWKRNKFCSLFVLVVIYFLWLLPGSIEAFWLWKSTIIISK